MHQEQTALTQRLIETPLGELIAIGDENGISILSFCDYARLPQITNKLCLTMRATISHGTTPAIESIKNELDAYFAGTLKEFTTPLKPVGTVFQQQAWAALQTVQYGTVKSYRAEAEMIQKSTAVRAVANANGANPIVIAIPCHRIISSNGGLGGYSCGIERKKWLLEHEQKNAQKKIGINPA